LIHNGVVYGYNLDMGGSDSCDSAGILNAYIDNRVDLDETRGRERSPDAYEGWRQVYQSALPEELYRRWQERFGVEILDGIGTTEILHIFLSNRPGQSRPGSTGLVVPGYEARIVDDEGQPVAAGEIGNLRVKGDSTMSHYWNQPAKTKAALFGELGRGPAKAGRGTGIVNADDPHAVYMRRVCSR